MQLSQFRSLEIGDKVSLFPDVVNTVSNQYIRVIGGVSASFIEIDGANKTPIGEDVAELVSLVSTVSHPVVINTDGFETRPMYNAFLPGDTASSEQVA